MDEFPIYFVGLLVVGTVLLLPIMALTGAHEKDFRSEETIPPRFGRMTHAKARCL